MGEDVFFSKHHGQAKPDIREDTTASVPASQWFYAQEHWSEIAWFVDHWRGPRDLHLLDCFGASQKMAKAWKRRGFKASAYDIKLSTDTMDIVTESGFYNLLLLCLRLFLSLKVAFPPAAIPLRIVNPWRVHGCRSGSLCVSQMYMQQVHL